MRPRQAVGFLLLFGVSGAMLTAGPLPSPPDNSNRFAPEYTNYSTNRIEADLQLRAELRHPGEAVDAGGSPDVSVTLVNTSTNRTHRVVLPGLGSQFPTREPFVTWSATIDVGNGIRVPVTNLYQTINCVNCWASSNLRWPKDAVPLAPGERLEIEMQEKFLVQEPGRVRLRADYEYRAQRDIRPASFLDPRLMTGVPPFRLASNVVELEVVRPLDVTPSR